MVNQQLFRTWISGGDKELPYFDMPHEMNPFLGFRALRISISETGDAMFRTQIRALLSCFCSWSIAYHVPNGCTFERIPCS